MIALKSMSAHIEDSGGNLYEIVSSLYIGRSGVNTVMIDDKKVSRRHAVIREFEQDNYWAIDFGAKNGTQVNGQLIRGPVLLRHEDILSVAYHDFRFQLTPDADAQSSSRGSSVTESVGKVDSTDEPFVTHGYGVALVNSEGRIEFIPPYVSAWLRSHFPGAKLASDELPAEVGAWLRAAARGRGRREASPFVHDLDERRLAIRLEFGSSDDSELTLLFADMQLLLSSERMKLYFGFTRKESEVIRWVVLGKTNDMIAAILGIKTKTIEKHLGSVYEKLEVENRATAIMTVLDRLRADWL